MILTLTLSLTLTLTLTLSRTLSLSLSLSLSLTLTKARRSYESGYAAAPDCAPLLYAWAYFEMHQGRMREVQELLNKARDLDENAGQLWHMQALLQIKLKQLRVARATAEEGVRRAPSHAPLHHLLGSLYDKVGYTVGLGLG